MANPDNEVILEVEGLFLEPVGSVDSMEPGKTLLMPSQKVDEHEA